MAAQLWRGQSRIRCRPLLHNLVNGWRRAAVIRGFLWLKFFYKLFVCLALRQLLHSPKNGHEKTTVRVHRGSITEWGVQRYKPLLLDSSSFYLLHLLNRD